MVGVLRIVINHVISTGGVASFLCLLHKILYEIKEVMKVKVK